MGRVLAADVEARVGLGVAQMLGRLQAIGKGKTILLHVGQDVVAGAVEDAVDAADGVAGKRLAQCLDDRDATRRCGLEIEADTRLLGGARQFEAVFGKERLVGRHHMLAGANCRLDRVTGGAVRAADQLNEKVVAGIPRQRHRIVEPSIAR